MYAALLSCSDAYGLSVLDIAYGVALSILKGYKGDDEVALGLVGECLVLCGDVLEECGVVESYLVASLLEGDAEHLLALYGRGGIVRVNLYYVVCSFALVLEYLQCLISISRCYHSVADLPLDKSGGGSVANVAQCNEVAIRAHAVGTSGTGVCARER